MSSDTPETDNLARGNHVVPTEWAEQLERERDEAQEKYFAMRDLSNNATELAEKYKQERDEAQGLLRILAGLVAYGLGQSGEEWSLEAMCQATTAIQNAKSLEETK